MYGKVYLVPVPIGDEEIKSSIPGNVKEVVDCLNYFIVENVRTARRFIRKLSKDKDIDSITFFTLNKNTPTTKIAEFLNPAIQGNNIGIISEAGVPGVADPGGEIVSLAHKRDIEVIPLVGPSSIILALMASGFNGQNFAFRGYLPIKKHERIQALKRIEKTSKTEKQTQIFMEAPYRNNQLLSAILDACDNNTALCIASNITSSNEFIKTKIIGEWKKHIPDLNKQPTIFLLSAE